MKLTLLAILSLITLSACCTPTTRSTGSVTAALARAGTLAPQDLSSGQTRQQYDAAVSTVVAAWQAHTGEKPTREPWTLQEGGETWTVIPSWPQTLLFDRLIPVTPSEDRDLDRVVRREGVGVPFVARWLSTPERKKAHPFLTDTGYLSNVTVTVDPVSTRSTSRTLRLRIHDPKAEKTAEIAGQRRPLAADFSAVGEWIMEASKQKGMSMPGIGALRNSQKYLDKLGLISLEPPSATRIPVIFVHGLMSRPLTWHNAFNELGADPDIQKNYQLYFFRYPSGVPVVYSGAKFRQQLAVLHQELTRIGNTRALGKMVLIGHSMGGLVSKLQVQNSGDHLWINVFGARPSQLKLNPEELAAFKQYLEFSPNPHVDRVIFVCTPHRGSSMAQGFVGAVGRKLISLPGQILGNTFTLLQGDLPNTGIVRRLVEKGLPSSIDNLSPQSLFVQESIKIPLRKGLHVHSIIGNKDGLPLTDPKCSDGVVPYQSAHLDGVESELIVRSKHGAHTHPEAIAEMRRILLLHLKK